MKAPSLKDSLERWTGFPKLERSFEPQRTRKAAAVVEKNLGDVQPKKPSLYDLQTLHRRVAETWRRDRALSQLAPRDLRRLPWVLFYPAQADRRDWLGRNPPLVQEYGRWLSAGRRTRSVLALLHEFLRVYPVNLPTFEDLRRLLRETLEDSSSPPPSLKKWQPRCLDLGFLRKDGDLSLVGKLVSATDVVDDFLVQAGLEAGLARCGFLKSGIRKYLPNVSTRLTRDSIDDTQLARVLTLFECEGKLRFQSVRVEIASALLSPFMDTPPPADTKEQLQSFFLRHFGDPRLPSGKHRWYGVGEEVRHVVTRWLVKETLDEFIRLIKETALDQHWRYREKFWMACFHQDMIEDAWFVLGSRARILLRQLEEHNPMETGRLRGASSEQSVLLLRMSGVTVAEWSHNGSCRFWLDGNRDAPKLYQGRVYSGDELRRGSDFSQRHGGSDRGEWQNQIAQWLRENTGVSIARAKYMPDDLSGNIHRRQNVRRHRVRKIVRRPDRPGR